jgi:Methyltransferase domain
MKASFARALNKVKLRFLRFVYRRYMRPTIEEIVAPRRPIFLDHPPDPVPRYGYGKPPHPELAALIEQGRAGYVNSLRQLVDCADRLATIAQRVSSDPSDPTFFNRAFSGLDAVALYAFVRLLNPRTFLEIGSGNSTRFARRSIRDHGLQTRIVSVDPRPRREVDALCDTVIRQPLETLDPARIIEDLRAGDILFIDGSHRCFTNSDVTIVFLEVLPRLRPGVLVHFHDILLPYDYPPAWSRRYYSEQYLLACSLLGSRRFKVLLPAAFISADQELSDRLDLLWAAPGMAAVLSHSKRIYQDYLGFSFWTRIDCPGDKVGAGLRANSAIGSSADRVPEAEGKTPEYPTEQLAIHGS